MIIVENAREWLNLGVHHHSADLHSDRYGLKQLAIAVTQSGNVLALHTDGGSIMWEHHIPVTSHTKRLLLLRRATFGTPEILIVSQPSNVLLLLITHSFFFFNTPSSVQDQTTLITLKALTGEVLSTETLDLQTQLVVSLSQVDADGRHVILLVDPQHRSHIFPSTNSIIALANQAAPNTHFYLINSDLGQITGYKLSPLQQVHFLIPPPPCCVPLTLISYSRAQQLSVRLKFGQFRLELQLSPILMALSTLKHQEEY